MKHRVSAPTPPLTDTPITVPSKSRSMEKEREFISAFDAALKRHDLEKAAVAVEFALDHDLPDRYISACVGLVSNAAFESECIPPSLGRILRRATDRGQHLWAYNAGNITSEQAKTPEDYALAARYYKIAMAYTERPDLQAAAYVNYCPIVRDGLITGKPDWPAAVVIYETAANMGLLKAMVNAGNVSLWLADEGVPGYAERAANWYQRALDKANAGEPSLDMEGLVSLRTEVLDGAQITLAEMHIDRRFTHADPEHGIALAKALASRYERARNVYRVGLRNRLNQLDSVPIDSPACNWRSVLAALDWDVGSKGESFNVHVPDLDRKSFSVFPRDVPDHVEVETLPIRLADGTTLPLVVANDPCFVDGSGAELLERVSNAAWTRYPDGFLLVARRAYFIPTEGAALTPLIVQVPGAKTALQSLAPGVLPDELVQRAKNGDPFESEGGAWPDCMVSIAVNALEEGFSIVDHGIDHLQRCAILGPGPGGEWRMPFIDESFLLEWGRTLGPSEDGEPPPKRFANRRG